MLEAVLIDLPCIIKAVPSTDDGRRMVEVEASCEVEDSEGDRILQKALLNAADEFVRGGHLDIDHLSELGHRFGIRNPEAYIIGRPVAVKDIGDGRTSVVGEIMKGPDGKHDPLNNKYDAFWDSLKSNPPVKWRASIYGFPVQGETVDCRKSECDGLASRFLVKAMDWRSLAFTRNPVNDSIKGYAKIVKSNAYISEWIKTNASPMPMQGMGPPMQLSETAESLMPLPRSMDELAGQYHRHISKDCMAAKDLNSRAGFAEHFRSCCGADGDTAEMLAHALMYHCLLEH
jgi:hypothetical protein